MERVSPDYFESVWEKADQTEELQSTNTSIQQTIKSTTSPTTTNAPSLNEDKLITLINAAINKKYSANSTFSYIFTAPQLTEQDFFDIISIINKHSKTPSRELILKLTTKNTDCRQAIKHFIDLASKNIDNVTINTLETILHSTLPQPTAELNKLPIIIKPMIMQDAYYNINHSCDIILTGHTDRITSFDICTITHQAATSSADKTLRLWNLKTGKLIHIFSGENNKADYITFSPDGSHLVTTRTRIHKDVTSDIKLWETNSAQKLDEININHTITTLSYGTNNTFIARDITEYPPHIMIFSINNNSINILSHVKLDVDISINKDMFWNKLYKTQNPYNNTNRGSTLTVTKLNCPSLYLCKQAVKNTHYVSSETLDQLAQQPLFQELTEYEKNIITKSLLAKRQSQTNTFSIQ